MCPACGSRERSLVCVQNEPIEVLERWRTKLKGPLLRRRRRAREMLQGQDLHRKTGRWLYLYRLIDRVANRYRERITDQVTGEVVRDVDEPLDQHRGHGSARPLPPSESDGGSV